MYDPKTGAYFYTTPQFDNEGKYRFEHTYYLKYNSKKALYLIDQLFSLNMRGENDIFLAHVFIDSVFQSAGLIYSRFRLDKATGNHKKQNENNIKEYEFDERSYPLLSDKDFRNFIEHIEENDQQLIDNGQFFGTFNVVYPDLDSELKEKLLTSHQNNMLDLEKKTYSILLVKGEDHHLEPKTISLDELRQEFQKIYDRSSIIWDYMQDSVWF